MNDTTSIHCFSSKIHLSSLGIRAFPLVDGSDFEEKGQAMRIRADGRKGKPGLCRAVRSFCRLFPLNAQTVLFKKKYSSPMEESLLMYPMFLELYHDTSIHCK